MEFDNPYVLLLLLVVWLPLIAVDLWRRDLRSSAIPFPLPVGLSPPKTLRLRAQQATLFLRYLAVALIIVALSEPKVPSSETPIKREGIDILIVFDVSTSMKALDFQPTDRFTAAKQTISKFIQERENDRIGLVVFAGEAIAQCPLTLDHAVVQNILSTVKMEVLQDGTAIGDALALAVARLRNSEAKSKVLILLTDGENNRGEIEPAKAAELATEYNIRVHSIQVGRGGRVPYPVTGVDFFGNQVTTTRLAEVPVNPKLLREISDQTKGSFFIADDSDTLGKIFETIDRLEKTELPGQQFTLYKGIYHFFALPGLLLLLLEFLVTAFYVRKWP